MCQRGCVLPRPTSLAWVEHRSTLRGLGHRGESRNAGVGRSPTHWGCSQRRGIHSRRPFVGRASLDAAWAWAQRRIQEHGRRAKPDPRGVLSAPGNPVAMTFVGRASLDAARAWTPRRIQERRRRAKPDPRGVLSAPRHPVAKALRGSSIARRGEGVGSATNPGTRASGEARPTGGVVSAAASSREGPSWVEHRSTLRWLGHRGESRNAGVGRSPTHGGCCQRQGIHSRRPFVGRASLDATRAWAQRRIQERGRRAKLDPRGVLSAPPPPVAKAPRGSSIARRCVGLGAAANPGTQASGSARPTGGVVSAGESSRESPSWVEHRSTLRWLGHRGESRNAGVGQCPTHGGCCQRWGMPRRCHGHCDDRPRRVSITALHTGLEGNRSDPGPAVSDDEGFTGRSGWVSSDARTPPRRTSLGTRRPAAPHRGPTPPSPTRAARSPSSRGSP